MKNRRLKNLLLPLALVAAFATTPAQATETSQPNPKAIVKEDFSHLDFTTTVTRLKAQLVKDGWGMLTEINLGQRIAKKGVQLPGGLIILELTSGGATIPLLKKENTRYIAGLMPCSVSIYSMDDGRVVVSRMNAGMMAGMMEPKVGDVLRASANKLDESIARALARTAN